MADGAEWGNKRPMVVLAHGARKVHAAVKAANENVEWVVYDGEGHGWSLTSTRVD